MAYAPQRSTDLEARGPSRFLEQFKGTPFLTALLTSYLRRVQEWEDALWEVILSRNLQDGEGVVLDWIGNLVGRKREGLNDSDYKIALRAQIRINRTKGRPEDVIDVALLSLPDGVDFTYAEGYPCAIILEVLDMVDFKVSVLFRNLVKTKAGGVRLLLTYSTDDPGDVFLTSDYNPADPDYLIPVYDVDHGLGWAGDPTMGGTLTMIQGT